MVEHQQVTINWKTRVKKMKEILLALVAGLVVGVLFKFLKLPLPAPPVFSAVVGVFGVYFGGVIVEWVVKLIHQ
jgi:XapX domain-containing protein